MVLSHQIGVRIPMGAQNYEHRDHQNPSSRTLRVHYGAGRRKIIMNIAIIKTGGKQYIVTEGQKLKIEKLNQNEGDEFEFNEVLLFANGKEIKIGQPYIESIKVKAKVLKQGRGEKKIVFRFKNKTRYKKKKGHRQPFTEVEILSIS